MWIGLLFAISACFVWGLIFVIPDLLSDFSSVEVVLGRYLSYGTLSVFLLFRKGFSVVRSLPLRAWVMALIFGLACNIFYYFGIVTGLRYATPPITVLITGMAPIAITLYGNWHVREISFKALIAPCLWIALGMILVNAKEVNWTFEAGDLQDYLIGLCGVFVALVAWSWYAVHNARFLKKNPQIPSNEWATVIGVGTFIWALILISLFCCGVGTKIEITKFISWSSATARYFIGVGVLGVVCSWLGCFLWNRASTYLPVSLMGPFLIFETLFGLAFVYLYEFRLPTLFEFLGISAMLSGILTTVYVFRKRTLPPIIVD